MLTYFLIMVGAFLVCSLLSGVVLVLLRIAGCDSEEAQEGLSWALIIIVSVYIGFDAWLHWGAL